jgi:putative SOS response-associated peptidase YedK
MAKIHDRMPTILCAKSRDAWINADNEDSRELTALLKPYPEKEMAAYPISKVVNSPANDSSDILRKI